MNSISIIIPVFNEAKTIATLLDYLNESSSNNIKTEIIVYK